MATARVFMSGNSQAVRLPREFRVTEQELEISRRGDELVLRPPQKGMRRAFELLAALPDDGSTCKREDPPPQERVGL